MFEIQNLLDNQDSGNLEKAKQLAHKVVEMGCVYQKDNVFEPSKTGLCVVGIGEQLWDYRQNQLSKLGVLFNGACMNLLESNVEVQKWLGVTHEEIDLSWKTKISEQPLVSYFGVDVCGPEGTINDLNVDRATIVGFQPEFIQAFGEVFPWLLPKMVSFYDGLLGEIRRVSGKDKPSVFVLTAEDEHYKKPFETFSGKFGYKVGDISVYNNLEKNYDLVFRCIKSEVILGDKDKYGKLLSGLTNGLPMINPLGSYLMGNKGWEVILGVYKPGGVETKSWFPEPVILYSGKNSLAIDSNGLVIEKDELAQKLLENRKNLVAKKAFSFGGFDVTIGGKVKAWQWENLVKALDSTQSSWVFETLQNRVNAQVCVTEWENLDQEVKVVMKTLNFIQRLYACGMFPNDFAMTGEVFAGESLKVNASGYTFPVAFV